jgi:hypothetical protein
MKKKPARQTFGGKKGLFDGIKNLRQPSLDVQYVCDHVFVKNFDPEAGLIILRGFNFIHLLKFQMSNSNDQNSKFKPCVILGFLIIEYWNLRIVCNLVLEICIFGIKIHGKAG